MSADRRSSRGTRQHFVPAAYLGRFSWEETGRRRERSLWVKDGASDAHVAEAADVAWEIGLYDVENNSMGDAGTADIAWGYEPDLTTALDLLADADATVDGHTWASTLVPFVAGLFVRGPGFRDEFAKRLPDSPSIPNTADNATAARVIEFQLLLAPLMAAQWIVLHFPEGTKLVTSDAAYAVTSGSDGVGYVIPVDKRTALVIVPSERRDAICWTQGGWAARIERMSAGDDGEVASLNRAVGAFAHSAVYGPTAESVSAAGSELGTAPTVGAGLLGDIDLGCHIYDYFRVLAALRSKPEDARAVLEAPTWSAIDGRRWTAPVAVECLFPERTRGGVTVESNCIEVDLTYGREIRETRRAAKDFRTGAMALLPLSSVQENASRITGSDVPKSTPRTPDWWTR